MQSTRTDNSIAVALALGLHVLLLLGILFSPKLRTPPAKGAPVVADLIDARELNPALLRALDPLPAPQLTPREPTPPPPPELETPTRNLPDLVPVRDPEPVIDPQETEREAERLREEQAAETERLRLEQAAEAERKRQEEAERKRQEEAARRRRETEQQLERIRNERARAEREERQAQERLRELERRRAERSERSEATPQTASPPPGIADGDSSLRAQWISAMLAKIEREWIRPDSVRPGMVCPIRIRILAGGEVRSAEIQPACPYDEAAKRSVEAAVLKASPLPWAGYESVAVRDLIVRFQPSSR